jgi:hypothetical protein
MNRRPTTDKPARRSGIPHLSGAEAVINCAGVLQDAPGDSTPATHHTGIDNVSKACETLRRIADDRFHYQVASVAIYWLIIAKPQVAFLR